ncbi:MAG: hypothetical protein AAFN65_11520 [Bacteroidota bacterium]
MKPHLAISLLVLIISACTRVENPNYLPRESDLQAGIYNKYYVHYQPEDRNEWSTEHKYIHLQKRGQRILREQINPDYKLTHDQYLKINNNNWIVEEGNSYLYNGDTVITSYLKPYTYRFDIDSVGPSELEVNYSNGDYFYEYLEHLTPRDTTIENRPAKILFSEGFRIFTNNGDSTRTDISKLLVYVDGLGLYFSQLQTPDYKYIWELVEQIPEREYRRLLSRKPNRVAYINTNETLDIDSEFTSCDSVDEIVDYYNGDPDGAPVGKKRTIENLTKELWDFPNRSGESGYLTLRFVINCEGKVGRFATEQADLNFNSTTFAPDLINRAKSIVEEVSEWQPVVVRGEVRDSYAYITFKLQDAQVIDILP